LVDCVGHYYPAVSVLADHAENFPLSTFQNDKWTEGQRLTLSTKQSMSDLCKLKRFGLNYLHVIKHTVWGFEKENFTKIFKCRDRMLI